MNQSLTRSSRPVNVDKDPVLNVGCQQVPANRRRLAVQVGSHEFVRLANTRGPLVER